MQCPAQRVAGSTGTYPKVGVWNSESRLTSSTRDLQAISLCYTFTKLSSPSTLPCILWKNCPSVTAPGAVFSAGVYQINQVPRRHRCLGLCLTIPLSQRHCCWLFGSCFSRLLCRQRDISSHPTISPVEGAHRHTSREDIIRERENEFFRELAREKQSTNAHPLLHMIASQHKLNSMGLPQNELVPNGSMKNATTECKKSPYEQPQVFVEYMGRTSAHGTILKPADATRRCTVSQRKEHSDDKTSVSRKSSSSAARHRQFLSNTLNTVNEQLDSTTLNDLSTQGVVSACSKGS